MGKYRAVLKNDLKLDFSQYLDLFSCKTIDYMAVGVQNNLKKVSASVMSDEDWQELYLREGFGSHDPLRQAVFNSNRKIIFLDELEVSSSFGEFIMKKRQSYNIRNGIVFVQRNLDHNLLITIGTGYRKFKPVKFFMENFNSINMAHKSVCEKMGHIIDDYQTVKP